MTVCIEISLYHDAIQMNSCEIEKKTLSKTGNQKPVCKHGYLQIIQTMISIDSAICTSMERWWDPAGTWNSATGPA